MTFGGRATGSGGPLGRGLAAGVARGERVPVRKLRKLIPFFRPYRWQVLGTLVLMALVSLTGLASPALVQIAIDHGIMTRDRSVLVWAVVAMTGAGVVGWLAGYGQTYLSSWVGERMLFDLRTTSFAHMMKLSLGHHERVPTGVSVSRLTSDIEALDQLVTEGVTTLVVQGLTFVGVIVILFVYDWQLALWALAVFPLLILSTAVFRRVSAEVAHDLRTPLTRVRHSVELALAQHDEELRSAALGEALAGLDEALRLFSAVLDLAEIDAGNARARFEPIDLAEIADRVVDAYRAEIEASSRHI